MRFRSWFRSAPGIRAFARYPFGFKLSAERSFDRSSESSSKDSRKLFNPHLLSQTRTDVSVQFSRSRRRPAAGRGILAEVLFGVKRKVKPRFTFLRVPRRSRRQNTTSRPQRSGPAPVARGLERRSRFAIRQGDCTGIRAKNAQGLKESVGPGSNRAEGEVRATPLPRTNRAPCAKELSRKNLAASIAQCDSNR